ncbi:MAG: hypothetical protein ACRDZM_19225 [Acidimicrobiia bacterium]
MGWIAFLVIVGLVLGGVGIALEAFRWLLIVALIAIVTGGFVGWSRRGVA